MSVSNGLSSGGGGTNACASSSSSSSSSNNNNNHHHSHLAHHHHHHHQHQHQQHQLQPHHHQNHLSNSSNHNHNNNNHNNSQNNNHNNNINNNNNNNNPGNVANQRQLSTTTNVVYNSVNGHLVWPIVIRPLLCKIQKKSQYAAVTLLNALGKAENTEPGFLLEFVTLLLANRDINVNMTESLLRLQACIPEFEEQRCRRADEPFQELNRKTFSLKKILSRIPDEIDDRKIFLETIKEIASAIKKLLDCVNEISSGRYLASNSDKRAVDSRKREFIKDSKNFSQTLKEFFKGGQEQAVFQSAAQLIYATNSIQKTIKSRCDQR